VLLEDEGVGSDLRDRLECGARSEDSTARFVLLHAVFVMFRDAGCAG
jgi:hypothetical protein